jgi:hypothetical protein
MKKKNLVVITAFVCLVCFIVVSCSSLRRDEATITQNLQRITPLGIQYDVAAKELERRYGHIQKNETTGFLRQEGSRQEVVGVKSIQVHLGDYHHLPIGSISVDAFWGFDSAGKLVQIWVWKTTDSL